MNWIKCSERLPEVDERVLICVEGWLDSRDICIAYLSRFSGRFDADSSYISGYECEVDSWSTKSVIAWMALPQAPEGE